jgi:NAD(P)-dependent dehydrogenase (short-subunit alcohol dehydrogenase family)
MSANPFHGKVAVITGAGSGIGRALAQQLANAGARLALSDISEAGLADTMALLPVGTDARSYRLDVAKRDEVYAHADAVQRDFGAAHLLFNNAGVSLVATVEHATIEEIEWQLGINLWGVIYGTKAFLPLMRAQGSGHIINLSSIFGLIGVPCQSIYNISKFGVRGFSESLAQELAGSGIGVTCVHPGGIRTAIGATARFGQFADETERAMTPTVDKLLTTPPDDMARAILQGVAAGKRRVLYGNMARPVDWLSRLFPASYERFMNLVTAKSS